MLLRDGYIAVDWGTTNRRAYRIDAGGALVADHEDDQGVTAVAAGGFEAAAADIRTALSDLPLLMAGMIGSNRGWREAAYVPCPASAEALAKATLWIAPGRTCIIPGVCQRGAAGADVMRGEEVQVIGAIAAGLMPPDAIVCHPGTHAKWIKVANSEISAFCTMMTGEMFALLSDHSILRNQLRGSVVPDAAFLAGVDEALSGAELLSSLFRIRAGALLGEGSRDPAAHASGLLIGSDVREGLAFSGSSPVTLLGRPELTALYAAAIQRAGHRTTSIDGAEAFLAGIGQIAAHF
ncbi:2-dehydro-3-deoxygalactonokinase [Sandarakinorhabdus sp.]|uniref:2-dehydro-3-deoxygalactonokinase n=1 Tax=Sandarakinorhabdus sp. TaxID=1916663 RepID=UPI003F724ED1